MTQVFQQEELLKLCLTGDKQAWTVLVERFGGLVRWAIRTKIAKSRLSIDEGEIDDIFQQVFVDIWCNNRLKTLRSVRSLSSWLVIISQNATINFARSEKRFLESQTEQVSEDIAYTSTNPRTRTDDNQLYKTVEELVSALPLKEQRVITLELFYDLKHREIAKIMGIPINTVSTIIVRIKQGLREKLKERGYDA